MSDFFTTDKVNALLVLCLGYIGVSLFLRWLKKVDESVPLPDPEPCANCQSIDVEPKTFSYGARRYVQMQCPDCFSTSYPVRCEEQPTREELAQALYHWNKIMREDRRTPPPFV